MKKINLVLICIIYFVTVCNAQYITLYTPNGSTIQTFLNAEGTAEWQYGLYIRDEEDRAAPDRAAHAFSSWCYAAGANIHAP